MIDAHIHVAPPHLPGVGSLSPILDQASDQVAVALRREMEQAGVSAVLAMGSAYGPDEDPLGISATLNVARGVPGLHAIGVANPLRGDPEHMRRIEKITGAGQIKGLKVYLG